MTGPSPLKVELPFGIPPDEKLTRDRRGGWAKRWVFRILAVAALLVLPFVVLVRTSVFFYGLGWIGGWTPILGAVLATTGLLAAYGALIGKRFRGSWKLSPGFLRALLGLVAAFTVYGAVFVTASRSKTETVREGFREVHPVLRLATGVLVLADASLLVTDTSRTMDDYRRMGLTANEASLHLRQSTGWVHAVDLRTLGRSARRNGVMSLYFWGMGFRTLRHRGTADHLHVSLPLTP